MNPSDLETLVRRYGETLRVYAATFTPDAEDVLQEAFVDLWQASSAPDNPVAWLFAAVRRRAISRSRSRLRRNVRERTVAAEASPPVPGPDAAIVAADERDRLRQAVERLAAPLREVVILHTWGRLTLSEVAALTEVSIATVSRRYQAALSELRLALDETTDQTAPSARHARTEPSPPPWPDDLVTR